MLSFPRSRESIKRHPNTTGCLFCCSFFFILLETRTHYMKNFERLNRLPPFLFSFANELKIFTATEKWIDLQSLLELI